MSPQSSETCPFNKAWIGRCGQPAKASGFCAEHDGRTCWCGAQADHDCSIAGSFVCGYPLCAEHQCHIMGWGGSPHSELGHQQWDAWKARRPIPTEVDEAKAEARRKAAEVAHKRAEIDRLRQDADALEAEIKRE